MINLNMLCLNVTENKLKDASRSLRKSGCRIVDNRLRDCPNCSDLSPEEINEGVECKNNGRIMGEIFFQHTTR